jgi:predicted dehydrogenase
MILGATAKGTGKTFKVGLLGCGGRGNGALRQSVEAGKILGFNVEVVGTADYFKDRAEKTGSLYSLPSVDCFGGPDAYRKLIETDVEVVLMAVAPLFRPLHLEACVKAGKHVFCEKPVAVDPPGCRRVIAAGELAKNKGVIIISGVDNRHSFDAINTRQALTVETAWGPLYGGRIAYLTGHFFSRKPIAPKEPADLIRTWQNWIALSGDHIVEQHVHNIDAANWFAGHPPVSAVGLGGRSRRPAGDMYDFFSVDFDYGDGVHVQSVCRQVAGCFNWVGHDFVYEKGRTSGRKGPKPATSPIPADLPEAPSNQVQEQTDALYYVNKGKPLNDARDVAESTATAVMGRISAYTGQQVSWDEIMGDPTKKPELYNLTLKPTAEDFETGNVEIPKEGVIPIPGQPV